MFLMSNNDGDIYMNVDNIIYIKINKDMFGLYVIIVYPVQGDPYSIGNFVDYDNAKEYLKKFINNINKYYIMKDKGELHC